MTALVVTYGTVQPATTGQSNGSISATTVSGATGPYTASWSPSSVQSPSSYGAKTGLAAGSYVLTITSADSQTSNHTFVIASVPPLALNAGGVHNQTIGSSTVTGGTGPYTVSWSPSNPALTTLSGGHVAPGTYTITVTDANARTITHPFTVKKSPKIYKTAYGSSSIRR